MNFLTLIEVDQYIAWDALAVDLHTNPIWLRWSIDFFTGVFVQQDDSTIDRKIILIFLCSFCFVMFSMLCFSSNEKDGSD